VEDLPQEVFLVVERRIDSFQGGNVAAWLYGIARRTVRAHRRKAWFPALAVWRGPGGRDCWRAETPDSSASRSSGARPSSCVAAILQQMSAVRSSTFILFEIEGYSGEEIAQLEACPVNTVYTRLHHAAKTSFRLLAARLPAGGRRHEASPTCKATTIRSCKRRSGIFPRSSHGAPSQERMWRVRRGMEQKRAGAGPGVRRCLRGPRALALASLAGVRRQHARTLAQAGVPACGDRARDACDLSCSPPLPRATARRLVPSARARRSRSRRRTAPAVVEVADAPSSRCEATAPDFSPPEPQGDRGPPRTGPAARPERHSSEPRRREHVRPLPQPATDNELVRRAVKALRVASGEPALAARLLEAGHKQSRDGALAKR
jgi:RNA polymerase sigma-70 factor (ECF subfamily)